MLSVSVGGRRRAGARPVSVGPTGLLASGLLLRPSVASLVPLRTDRTLTLAGVTSTLVVWSGPVSERGRELLTSAEMQTKSVLSFYLAPQFQSLPV